VLGSFFLDEATRWFSSSCAWLLDKVGVVLDSASDPDLSSAAWRDVFSRMLLVSAGLAVPVLLGACGWRMLLGDASGVVRLASRVPVVFLGSSALVALARAGLAVTDAASAQVGGGGLGARHLFESLTKGLADVGGQAPAIDLVLTLVALAASLVLFAELVVRQVAVELTVLFLPLGLLALFLPSLSHLFRRMTELLFSFVAAKFVMVAALRLGAAEIGSAAGLSSVVSGLGVLACCILAPFAVLKLSGVVSVEAALIAEAGLSAARAKLRSGLDFVDALVPGPEPTVEGPGEIPAYDSGYGGEAAEWDWEGPPETDRKRPRKEYSVDPWREVG
jgi:uncharacterized membrane protein YhaH (DUF805 family)